jgi:hypothetical protein
MKRSVAWLALAALAVAAVALAQTTPAPPPAKPPAAPATPAAPAAPSAAAPDAGPVRPQRAPAPHRPGELDCRNCHLGEHQGIVQMYIGMGGRGTPTIPSHMFQVRVECIACHATPRIPEGSEGLSGQTFTPSEKACLGCHGEKYRGMLRQWTGTLARMTDVVTPKLAAARAALPAGATRDAKATRASKLVDDAAFNIKYVGLAKGVHNVFYAADLLKVANGWLDEAIVLLGRPASRVNDELVRGGYCAVLCHQAAGVKQNATVTFAGRPLPHVKHVAEFGATCTSCHSSETHKRVTATAATCASCHHSPQNDRCEGCHARQAAFYHGQTKTPLAKVEANIMAAAVPCVGCHDFGQKNARAAIADKCIGCHDSAYTALLTEWRSGFDGDFKGTAEAIAKAQAAVTAARKAGRPAAAAEARLKEARNALALVRASRPAHNPLAADALLEAARRRAQEAMGPGR